MNKATAVSVFNLEMKGVEPTVLPSYTEGINRVILKFLKFKCGKEIRKHGRCTVLIVKSISMRVYRLCELTVVNDTIVRAVVSLRLLMILYARMGLFDNLK